MKAFFGGQIKQDCRGDLAVVVRTHRAHEPRYSVSVNPVLSPAFVYHTGRGDLYYPMERVYVGVSESAGRLVVEAVDGKQADGVNLKGIDELVVSPEFVDRFPQMPEMIVLRASGNSYAVVQE